MPLGGLKKAVKSGVSSVGSVGSSAWDTIESGASSAWGQVESGAGTAANLVGSAGQGVIDIHRGAGRAFEDAHNWAAEQMGYPNWQTAAMQGGMGFAMGGPAGAAISLGMGSQHNPLMQAGGAQQAQGFGNMGDQPLMQGSAGNFDFGMPQAQQGQGGSTDLFTPGGSEYGQGGQASTQLLQPNPDAFQFRPLISGRSDVTASLA